MDNRILLTLTMNSEGKENKMGRGGRIGNLYRPLNQRQIETIHQKSLDVIEHIGLTFETGLDDMLDMVEEAGCKVDR